MIPQHHRVLHRSYRKSNASMRTPLVSSQRFIECLAGLASILAFSPPATAQTTPANAYVQHNLVSDVPGLADVTDPNLVDPWGIALSAAGPFWLSDAGTGKATVYNGAGTITPLVVTVPAGAKGPTRASVTGQVSNAATAFILANGTRSSFIFSTEDGTVSAWNTGTTAQLMVDNSAAGAVYEGLAIGTSSVGPTLYLPNFSTGNIDVFDGKFAPATLAGNFKDPTLPDGFAPFNIWPVNGKLYVMYAKQNAAKKRDTAGTGNGYVSTFDFNGNFLKRVVSQSALNSPWGVAQAPATWGAFGGALLVGNFGNGRINAFDANTGSLLGTLQDQNGAALTNSGLWGIVFGNGGNGGDVNTLYFTAGIQNETHGLFGAIAPPSSILTVVNAASGQAGPISPGEVVLLGGFTIGPSPRANAAIPATGTLGSTIGGVTVTFNGTPAPILYASASTVATIVPYELAGFSSASVALKFTNQFNNVAPAAFTAQVGLTAPGLFTIDSSGSGQAVVINQDGTVNSATNAAAKGSVVLLYGTGEGPTAPSGQNGSITVGRILPGPILPISLTIGGLPARVISATSAPGSVAGILQVEAIIPTGVTTGAVPVVMSAGSASSQTGVTLSVK
jgi:uncharacterized protein (TIGR03118 family)